MSETINIANTNELSKVVNRVKQHYTPKYQVILLKGDLGTGKTTFTKKLLESLGVKEDVSSPTYTLVNEYKTPENSSIFHFDLYRLNKPEEALDMGWYDYLDSGNLCLVEWPEILESYLPNEFLLLEINKIDNEETSRQFKLSEYPKDFS